MDKKQAAEFLGVTTRTIENYAKAGRISVTYTQGKNGKQADYKDSELQRLKEELEMPVHRSVVAPNCSEIKDSGVFEGLAATPQSRLVELFRGSSCNPPIASGGVIGRDCCSDVGAAVE